MTDKPGSLGPAAPAKVDPETLVLRATPGRVTRFRRGAIIGIAAAGATAIAGVAWLALKPPSLNLVGQGDDKQIAAKVPPDALAGAPASYDDVPRLGPPLPGDLGRPILNRQRETGLASLAHPAADAAARASQQAKAERQRIAAERKAARESGVLLQVGGARTGTTLAALPAETGAGDAAPQMTGRDPKDQQRKNALAGRSNSDGDTNPHRLAAPVSPWTLHAGSVIAASLITGLNSDLPGMVTAQVTQNVFDSTTGRTLLVPQGSRLIGNYDSVVAFGQRRALVLWQRLILPDGAWLDLDNAPAADPAGYAGLAGEVDFHSWRLLKGVAISTLLGVGTELSLGGESDLVAALRDSAQSNAARAGDQITRRNLDIPPTITVRPGTPVRLIVNRDLVLAPWEARP